MLLANNSNEIHQFRQQARKENRLKVILPMQGGLDFPDTVLPFDQPEGSFCI
jgi:hypothetical protein